MAHKLTSSSLSHEMSFHNLDRNLIVEVLALTLKHRSCNLVAFFMSVIMALMFASGFCNFCVISAAESAQTSSLSIETDIKMNRTKMNDNDLIYISSNTYS